MLAVLMVVALSRHFAIIVTQSVESLIAPLSSNDAASRREAERTLRTLVDADPALLQSPALQNALTAAMTSENAAMYSGQQLSSHAEWFDEEIAPIIFNVLGGSAPLSAAFLEAASRTTYNPGSEFSRALARVGPPVIPLALQLVADSNRWPRIKGYRLLGYIIQADRAQSNRTRLTPQQVSSVTDSIRHGLQDPDPFVRWDAIEAIVDAGDRGALTLLAGLAANDPDTGAVSVRSNAARAMQRLQK